MYELITALVDKSLVTLDDDDDGQPCYRLLETLRAYALDQLRSARRAANASATRTLLGGRTGSNHELLIPLTRTLRQVDRFYDNVRAAMDWAVNDPRLGLRLLYSFAKVCQDLGRAGDAVAAAERLLTPDDAGPYGELWLRAAGATSIRYDLGGSYDDYLAFVQRMSDVATRLDDPYHLALARFHTSSDPGDALILRDLADQRGESYVSAVASAMYAQTIADGDPSAARDALRDAEVVAVGVGSRIPLDYVRRTACRHARDTGRLATSMSLARTLLSSSSQLLAQSGVLMLGEVGLLAGEAARHPRSDRGRGASRSW